MTNTNITTQQIQALRQEGIAHGDSTQIALCDRALGERVKADDYTGDARDLRRVAEMTVAAARRECADVINAARAMDDSQAVAS